MEVSLLHHFGMPTRITSFDLDPVSRRNARSYQSGVSLDVASPFTRTQGESCCSGSIGPCRSSPEVSVGTPCL